MFAGRTKTEAKEEEGAEANTAVRSGQPGLDPRLEAVNTVRGVTREIETAYSQSYYFQIRTPASAAS